MRLTGQALSLAVADPAFPADYLHPQIVTASRNRARYQPTSTEGYSGVPAFSRVHDALVTQRWAVLRNYLRTVIVTAAVYRGFGRELRTYVLTLYLNLPTPGRRQSLYIHLRVSRDLCF